MSRVRSRKSRKPSSRAKGRKDSGPPPDPMTERIIELSKEAIREEVAWRRREGLPILVLKDGKVVDINKPRRRRSARRKGKTRGG